jgi:hypothetical protein
LSTPNMARPYITEARRRRSMMKLSKTRSSVERTAQTKRTGAGYQLNEAKDQVALDA